MLLRFRLKLFINELLLFSATLAVGILSAYYYPAYAVGTGVAPVSFGWKDVLVVAVFVFISTLLYRNKRAAGFFFKSLLGLIVFVGAEMIFGILFPGILSLVIAILCVVLFFIIRAVLAHDLGVLVGIVGIGSVLGFSISPLSAVLLLVVLSFYDIIAVYKTKHMLKMARAMIDSGALFGFIIPESLSGFFSDKKEAQANIGDKFMILGSGDVAWPLVLVSSVASYSIGQGILIGIFSLAGLFLTHLIFINQVERRAMAALPPIATMTIIGYLITLLAK